MPELTSVVISLLSFSTLLSDIFIVLSILAFTDLFLFKSRANLSRKFIKFLGNNSLILSFIVALVATSGSLFYSEIAAYLPCKLCWVQRIFIYSQVPMLAIAIIKNDKRIADYIIGLSLIGAFFSAYHYYLQRIPTSLAPCTTIGYSTSCSESFVMHFGYISIPVMALTSFCLILIFMISAKISK